MFRKQTITIGKHNRGSEKSTPFIKKIKVTFMNKIEKLQQLIEQDIKECKFYKPLGENDSEIAIQTMEQILRYIKEIQNGE